MRKVPRALLGLVVVATLTAGCVRSIDEDGWYCRPLVEVLGAPQGTWLQARSAERVDPGVFPEADAILASTMAQGADWTVVGLVDPVVVRVASATPEMIDPAHPEVSPVEGIPGVDGRTPAWVLAEGDSLEQLLDRHPTGGWLLGVGPGGFLGNLLAVDGDEVTFVPGPCAAGDTRSLSESAVAVDRTPADLAVALITGDPTVPELPGSTVPD